MSPATAMFPTSIESLDWGNPDHVVTVACAAFAAWCLVASWVTGTHSHVDRLWSITPAVYAGVYAYMSAFDARCTLMASLVAVWGARLTYNFARKGGYSAGEQDYRWPVLQGLAILGNPVAWQIFNVSFIAAYQHFLLLLISAGPMSVAFAMRGTPLRLTGPDLIATACFISFLALETAADEQQWRFQNAKKEVKGFPRERRARDDYARGFLTRGLFKFSRHPNFFAEQGIWVSFALFAVLHGSGEEENFIDGAFSRERWSSPRGGLGAILLVLLFQGSTRFTESITLKKYPAYADYRKCTSQLVPLPPFGTMPPFAKPRKLRD
jgi:steroid 5-alpha reductase family enzyme